MMIRYIDTQEDWNGEAINDIRHPRNIEQLWSAAELAKIGLERYTPPKQEPIPVDPLTQPISRVQFKAVLRIAGLYDAVAQAIEAIPDPIQRAVAQTKFEESNSYDRDDPLFTMLAPAIGVTDEQIDALWTQAQGIV
jgi:hypothetical protein